MTANSSEFVFLADSIGKSFWGNQVLKAASLWARPGLITVLFGLNGSGKTTLIKAALGLLRADRGMVQFEGRTFLAPRLHKLARLGLFYVPDRGLLSRRMRVERQLELITARFGTSHLGEWLERLEVLDLLSRSTHQLSGGERRRVEVAMAAVRDPSCLIIDEPLTEIEPIDRSLIGGVLRQMAASGCAVVVTGHDVADLMALADEVIWMVAGTTHGLGTPDEAKVHHQFSREYLGTRG